MTKANASTRILAVFLCNLLALENRNIVMAKRQSFGSHRRSNVKRSNAHNERGLQTIDSYDGLYGTYADGDWQYEIQPHKADKPPPPKKCGPGKGKTCPPTTSPSTAPSVSPSVSVAPSSLPSEHPTRFPTTSPSSQPSVSPTISLQPSVSPSAAPSRTPSASPSKHPTRMPSDSPSANPTTSVKPSSTPSVAPSAAPTTAPSSPPTPIVFVTQQSSGLVTTCVIPPPNNNSGVLQNQTLAFQYNLYTTRNASFPQEIAIMKSRLQEGMARALLTCEYDSAFSIASIHAPPDDTLDNAACDTTHDPPISNNGTATKCGLVNAEWSLTVYFPSVHRRSLHNGTTNASPEVLKAVGDYLKHSMNNGNFDTEDIVQVTFQGFVNTQAAAGGSSTGDTGVGGGGSTIAGATGSSYSQPSNSTHNRLAVGGVVVGMAAIVLIVMLVAGSRRRKQRQEAYLKHLEAMSVSDLSYEQPREYLADGKVKMVLDDSAFSSNDESGEVRLSGVILRDLDTADGDRHHVHNCSSATCPVCRNRELNPTFIHAPSRGYSISDVQRLREVMDIRDSYRTPDMVEL